MGGLRINRSLRWHYWALTVICLGCVLSVAAWLVSVPSNPAPIQKRSSPRSNILLFQAAKKADSETSSETKRKSKDDEETSRGKKRRFGGDNKSSESDNLDEGKDSPGFFRSMLRRYGNRKEAKKAREQAELEEKLTAILDMEASDSRFFDISNFNTSSITSALTTAESRLKAARDELRSVRTAKESPSAEEQRLEELRRRAAAERERRLRAQRIAEAKKKSKKEEENKKEKEDKSEKQKRSVARKGERDEDESENNKRSNPLSVAQKFFSGVFEKQREEWIPVAPKTRISPGEIVPITVAGLDLLLVASKDGSALHCIANSCPHLGTPLETGVLERLPIESSSEQPVPETTAELQEMDIANLLAQDGCEDCIVCPLHRTAFALESGEVRGEWCPYPPVIGKVMGTVKAKATLPVFDVRTRGKNIEVRLNTPFEA